MDEYNSEMDPEVKKYFRKIINSFSWGLLWLLVIATAGIFFRLGEVGNGFKWYNVIYYLFSFLSLLLLLRYMHKLWKN